MKDKDLLDWLEFVATKFAASRDGWVYTRDTGSLEHIRYKSDRTGYNHWWKRFTRGIRGSKVGFTFREKTLRGRIIGRWCWFLVNIRKDNNLPDGVIKNAAIITHWEEDGEYITLMGPSVGAKVVTWLRAEPDNPYAVEVLKEMHRVAEMSWPSKEEA